MIRDRGFNWLIRKDFISARAADESLTLSRQTVRLSADGLFVAPDSLVLEEANRLAKNRGMQPFTDLAQVADWRSLLPIGVQEGFDEWSQSFP